MGYWSRLVFGLETLPMSCFVFGGMVWNNKYLNKLLGCFDSHKKLSSYPPTLSYLVKKRNKEYILCWGAYGGSSTMEIIKILADGNVKNLIFIGWAYSPKNTNINSLIIPNKIRNLDGVTSFITKLKFSYPSNNLFKKIITKLNKRIEFKILPCATVPFFFHKDLPKIHKESNNYFAVDMEGSVVLAYSKFYKINSVVLYIITDSEKVDLEESNKYYKKQRLKTVLSVITSLI